MTTKQQQPTPGVFLLAVGHQNSANSPKTLQNGLRRGQTTKIDTLGARGFSRVVSGFGHARVFGLRPTTCPPAADEAVRRRPEKTSGTQFTYSSETVK